MPTKNQSPAIGFELKEHAALTDVGVRRSHNQDSHGMLPATAPDAWAERGHVFLVADGMGAHAVGELASQLAADLILHTYQKHAINGPVPALRRAFQEANATIHQRGQQNREFQGMGTTSTALLLRPEGAWIGHVGDSRAYRIRGDQVEQLSFDHSLQWELARRQQVSPDRIAGIPSNVIVRSLGPEAQVQADVEGPHPVQAGDSYLLCSDGLSNQVTDQEMGATINHLPLKEATQFLVDLANLRGGPDNITVVACRLPQPGETTAGKPPPSSLLPGPTLKKLRQFWPSFALGAGILLTFLALALIVGEMRVPAIVTFVVAAGVLLAGIVALVGNYRHEATRDPLASESPSPPQVYRRASCAVDAGLLERLMQAEKGLVELARQKNWQVDWTAYEKHHTASLLAFQQGKFPLAFTEQARALAVLFVQLREHRQKDETFKPNW